jgi:hypothetical protein
MVLHAFDKRLLEFIYQLTLHKKLMNSREMAQNITIQGKNVSERTIKRWLKHLKENYYFTYYPSINYKCLGLNSTGLILLGLKQTSVLDTIPYKTYLMKGVDLKAHENCFFANYRIPEGKFDEFSNFWKTAKNKGIVKDFFVFKLRQIITTYSPIHEIIGPLGTLTVSNNSKVIPSEFVEKIMRTESKLNNRTKVPLIVPVLLEHFKDCASSKKIWHRVKEKFGDDIWPIIKKSHTLIKIKKQTDGTGIKCVQHTLKFLYQNFDEFFQQMKFVYSPLYSKNINLYFVLKLKNPQNLKDLVASLLHKSLCVITYKTHENGLVILDIVTNSESIASIVSTISGLTVRSKLNRILLMDYADSSNFWENKTKGWLKQHYHELFDPKTVSWKYDHEEYLNKLRQLSISGE